MSNFVQLVGRVLLALPFLIFGFLQFTNISGYAVNPAIVKFSHFVGGVLSPTPLAYIVAAIDLFGGILVIVGLQTRVAAIVLTIFVALTLYFAHAFWTMDGPAKAANQAHFYKNLALMGGLLFLSNFGAGTYSLDAWLRRKKP
jgi:putative oxidoreductase